jgi:cytochrome c
VSAGRAVLAAVFSGLFWCGPAWAGDTALGEKLFDTCRACHALDPQQGGMSGPHLAGLKNRTVGSAEGFDYSPALRAARDQGLAWDEARLAAYLADPDAMFRGGWMSAPGLDREDDRAAVARFLMSR